MERSKYIIVFILVCIFLNVKAEHKKLVYDFFISNKMRMWAGTIQKLQQNIADNDQLLELINYQYGYIAWCIGNNKKNDASNYLKLMEKNIELAEKNSVSESLVNSYKAALYGFKIGLNIMKAPFYGPKSVEYAQKAMAQDQNNPHAYIQFANAKYYAPESFGGSKFLALEYYTKAEKIMEANPELLRYDWNYLNLQLVIAQAYTKLNCYQLAKNYYEKILRIEPNFSWVKEKLYPELLEKMKNK